MARDAHSKTTDPARRVLALRLRLRLLQEAHEAARAAASDQEARTSTETAAETASEAIEDDRQDRQQAPDETGNGAAANGPVTAMSDEEEPDDDGPATPTKRPRAPKLVSIDLEGDALSRMMSELGGQDDDDDGADQTPATGDGAPIQR